MSIIIPEIDRLVAHSRQIACGCYDTRDKPHTEIYAARCRVVLGQDIKDNELATAKVQPERIQVNSVNFNYSAMSPAAETTRRLLKPVEVYRRNPAVTGINKKGSHLHYLGRKIKQMKSKIASLADDLNKEFTPLMYKMNEHICALFKKKRLLDLALIHGHDVDCRIEPLNHILARDFRYIKRNIKKLKPKIKSSSLEIRRKMSVLRTETQPYDTYVSDHMTQLNSQACHFYSDIKSKILRMKFAGNLCLKERRHLEVCEARLHVTV